VGQGKLGLPSEHFFQLLRVIMAHAGQYVGAVGHLEGAGCGCGCGVHRCHRDVSRSLQVELVSFETAVSGENGILLHPFHWHGFTGVFNALAPRSLPAMKYYSLILRKDPKEHVSFVLPYPLDPLLIVPRASYGHKQERFLSGSEVTALEALQTSRDQYRRLRDRSGYARSDDNCHFSSLCGEEQLFTALSALESSWEAGRAHVVVFLAFWMLMHLWGVLQPPAGSPNFYFRKFKVDVYVRLAMAMSTFYFILDLPLSCLALAEGSCVVTGGGACPTNVLANAWQMTCARQAVLATYGLYREAAALFEKNLGRIPVASFFYDDLVLVHVSSQLNWALDILLETYVGQLIHKFCANSKECWDPVSGSRDKYDRLLDRLKRMIHGRLAESNVSERLRVNLLAVLKLLPLFEMSMFRLRPGLIGRQLNDRLARAFRKAHLALRTDVLDAEDRDLLSRTLLVHTFGGVVPAEGHRLVDREDYVDWINTELRAPERTWSVYVERNTSWKDGRAYADRLFAKLVFFSLWQGPTQLEPFWPAWPDRVPPHPEEEEGLEEGLDEVEWERRHAVAVQFRVTKRVLDLYKESTSGRHHRLPLVDCLLHYLMADRFVSPFEGMHVPLMAAKMCVTQAEHFALRQSGKFLYAGLAATAEAESRGAFLRHVLNQERVLTQEVLDFGRNAARWARHF